MVLTNIFLTQVTSISPHPLSVFHLACAEYRKLKVKRVRDPGELERRMTNVMERKRTLGRSSRCGGPEECPQDCDSLRKDTLAILQLLVASLKQCSGADYRPTFL